MNRFTKKSTFIILFLQTAACSFSTDVYVIIHGTWATGSDWYKPGGDFFTALSAATAHEHAEIVCFLWSGNADFKSREIAGHELAVFLQRQPPTKKLYLIGHSHGANVGILACKELARNKNNQHRIEAFFALAAPVNINQYMPPMNIIGSFYNFFSCNDFVQPVFGIFGRVYPDHERIANLRLQLHEHEPNHAQLHDPLVATYLCWLHHVAHQSAFFDWKKQYLLHVSAAEAPKLIVDHHRQQLLEDDRKLVQHLMMTLTRQKKGKPLEP
jgi:hypothetical protein